MNPRALLLVLEQASGEHAERFLRIAEQDDRPITEQVLTFALDAAVLYPPITASYPDPMSLAN